MHVVHLHVCICMRAYVCVFVYVYLYVCMRVHARANVCVCVKDVTSNTLDLYSDFKNAEVAACCVAAALTTASVCTHIQCI